MSARGLTLRSVLLAGCGWLRKKIDLVERLAQHRDEGERKAQMGNGREFAHDFPLDAYMQSIGQGHVPDARAQARRADAIAENQRRLISSKQSNLAAQIVDRVGHTSLSLESRQSDLSLTVAEGRP